MQQKAPANGRLTAGDWVFEKLLGQGSYGKVRLWKNTESGEFIAVKNFLPKNSPTESESSHFESRYRKEVAMMYNDIDNSHIVATVPTPPAIAVKLAEIKDSRSVNNSPWYEPVGSGKSGSPLTCLPLLTMEYCDGGDLRRTLDKPENASGLSEFEVRSVLANISDAIMYLHGKHIVHRDIKPENILIKLASSAEGIVYKLSDLGFAKDVSDDNCNTILGTPPYVAPEIFARKPYDHTVDYWSFGLIAFEIACGRRPFLHGELPGVWLPYVEKKAKDHIAITRNADGNIEHSKEIPYDTHLSKLFQKCLEPWLASMLQFDASRRGKYVLTTGTNGGAKDDSNALVRLKNMLGTKYIEVYTFTERLVYAIGKSKTIDDVMGWIQRDTTTLKEHQMLLTGNGDMAKPEDFAITYHINRSPLYLIPKEHLVISTKVRLPIVLRDFLQNKGVNGKIKVLTLTGRAAYCGRQQFERVNALHQAVQAIRTYYRAQIEEEISEVCCEVGKRGFAVGTLVELEEKLCSVDQGSDLDLDCSAWDEVIHGIKAEADKLVSLCDEKKAKHQELSRAMPSKLDALEPLFKKILQMHDTIKRKSSEKEHEVLQALHITLCEFLQTRESSIQNATKMIQEVLARLPLDNDLLEDLRVILAKLNELTDRLISTRVAKQRHLLESIRTGAGPGEHHSLDLYNADLCQPAQVDYQQENEQNLVESKPYSPDIEELLRETERLEQQAMSMSMSMSSSFPICGVLTNSVN